MRWLLDAEFSGREHIPEKGPFIVTANHLSLIDPVLVSAAVGRLVRFLALDELFGQHEMLDRMMLYFGAIPLSRVRAPLGAMQKALEVLDRNDALGIFPEGARAEHWGARSIKRGAAWLSIATGAPILPCSVIGTEATLSLAEPRVRIPSVKISLHPVIEPGPYIHREDPLADMMDEWVAVIDAQIRHWKHEE
jgi:1-acyl-sn-glycerol-3-phosphate acyltransferase